MAADTLPNPTPHAATPEPEPIPFYDRLVLWMFVAGILLFVTLLLADAFAGLF